MHEKFSALWYSFSSSSGCERLYLPQNVAAIRMGIADGDLTDTSRCLFYVEQV